MTPEEAIKMIFADDHFKDALTKQMSEDPRELTKFVALEMLVSLAIFNQNQNKPRELYLQLKPLIKKIFDISELYEKDELMAYAKENDLLIAENYQATTEEIQAAITKEYLVHYIKQNINLNDLIDPETMSNYITASFYDDTSANGKKRSVYRDITTDPLGKIIPNIDDKINININNNEEDLQHYQ